VTLNHPKRLELLEILALYRDPISLRTCGTGAERSFR